MGHFPVYSIHCQRICARFWKLHKLHLQYFQIKSGLMIHPLHRFRLILRPSYYFILQYYLCFKMYSFCKNSPSPPHSILHVFEMGNCLFCTQTEKYLFRKKSFHSFHTFFSKNIPCQFLCSSGSRNL